MNQEKKLLNGNVFGETGFTLVEVIIVLAIVSILSAIAVPQYMQWIKNAEYRGTARTVLFALREARSKAIATNLEHRVEFESLNRRYRVTRGNRASNSNNWNTVVREWVSLPLVVHMVANVEKIQLNTNGTANAGTISIQDSMAKTKYEVRIARTGKVRIPMFF